MAGAPAAADASRAATDESRGGGLGAALRAALQDGYYHSWRLVPANVVWSVTALAVATGVLLTPAAVVLLPILALPTAGIFRITTRIARGESVSFWDAVDAWRTDVVRTLAIGAVLVLATAVLSVNVATGLTSDGPFGWALATMAGWGLLATWILAWTIWPVVTDPRRAGQPMTERVRLAVLLALAHPLRIGGLALLLALLLALSAIAVVALATVSVVFAGLVASRFVLPAADRLEVRLQARATGTPGAAGIAAGPTTARVHTSPAEAVDTP